MPLHIGSVIEAAADYVLYYKKDKVEIAVAAPNKADAEELMEWLAGKFHLLPP